MTPFGGFVPLAAFFEKLGLLDSMAAHCPAVRTSPNASAVRDVLTSFILSCLSDGSRFNHINRLREDPTLCELFGLKKIVGDDAVSPFSANRYRRRLDRISESLALAGCS
jgi:hypothetical protein